MLSQKKSLRNDLSDYIEGHKMMIHIEEEEQIRYIETFNQTDIRITYYMDRQFRFEVPVSHFFCKKKRIIIQNNNNVFLSNIRIFN